MKITAHYLLDKQGKAYQAAYFDTEELPKFCIHEMPNGRRELSQMIFHSGAIIALPKGLCQSLWQYSETLPTELKLYSQLVKHKDYSALQWLKELQKVQPNIKLSSILTLVYTKLLNFIGSKAEMADEFYLVSKLDYPTLSLTEHSKFCLLEL